MALTVSTGFVVDDAIVVIENIVRFIEKGEPPLQAALKGARQIGFTVISISLSLVAVFIPLFFMSGLIGRLFHEFAVTLSAAILVSGVVSLTLTPMLCGRFLKSEERHRQRGVIDRLSERGFNAMHRFLRTRLEVGPQTRIHHAHCHRAGDHRDRLPLLRCAEGIFPATGHGTNDGHDRGRAGHFL